MKSREAKSAPSADLLVCFPPRAHLALMPKPICSPARPSEPTKRRSHRHRHRHHHNLNLNLNLKRVATSQPSPLLWRQLDSEPTSPKVTCAGQIKVRPGPGPANCKNWQSVMEEIERIHNKNKKKPSWAESLGFKKEILHFLACLRTIRLDFSCFGAFPQSDIVTDDDDEEPVFGENRQAVDAENNESSRAVFSKWFMVLQQNQSDAKQGNCEVVPAVPPPNALLLMRCRSAPAKSWMEEEQEEEEEEEEEEEADNDNKDQCEEEEKCREKRSRNLRSLLAEEKENVKQNTVVMKYDAGLCKISTDICRETWVVGGTTRDPLSRSRSWKR